MTESIRVWFARTLVIAGVLLILGLVVSIFWKRSEPTIPVSSQSPDKSVSVSIVESVGQLDRNFEVVLETASELRVKRVIFKSPDEGLPGTERFLWSKDSRYLLLTGQKLFVEEEDILPNGERLYLLYDQRTDLLKCNAAQARHPHFKLADLKSIDWEKPLSEWLGTP